MLPHRRRLRSTSPQPVRSRNRDVAQRRHMAMTGIDVSPVHGWHCTCERCARKPRNAG
ncbi:MAG TPA: hypothetical protein VG186_14670 [Solirubrobacteraceae bacterium]|jgi:hypothetical protein|nr:hypothetical protein [Solirubrobacteraceae bacterium]